VPGQKNHLDSIQTAKQQLVGSLPPWGFHFAPFHVFQSVDFVDAASAKDTERRCRMQVAHFLYLLEGVEETAKLSPLEKMDQTLQ
jgi:hypothetical protein